MDSTILSGILVIDVTVFVAVISAFAVRRLKSYRTFAENNVGSELNIRGSHRRMSLPEIQDIGVVLNV